MFKGSKALRKLVIYLTVLALIVIAAAVTQYCVSTHAGHASAPKAAFPVTVFRLIWGFVSIIPEAPFLIGWLIALACIITALVLISRGISYPSYGFINFMNWWFFYNPTWYGKPGEKVFPGYGPFGERKQPWC